MMSQMDVWSDEERFDLRATLRQFVLGELRLKQRDHNAILEACRDGYINFQSPESEREIFIQFAANELQRAEIQLASEKLKWPIKTDSDRLDDVETALRELGILLWQASPCCDTCTLGELQARIDVIDKLHMGFRDRVRGYAFFIDQNLSDMLSESTEISVYMGYGWITADYPEIPQETYKKNTLSIAREICECLQKEGLKYEWNGKLENKICVSLNWQRRNTLI